MKVSPSLPVILATPPPGATLPYTRVRKWPVALTGSDKGLMISWPGVRPGWSATFSAQVFGYRHLVPSNIPLSIINFMTPGVPPIFWTSSMTYLPDRFEVR